MRLLPVLAAAVLASGCAGDSPAHDGDAVAVCRQALAGLEDGTLATTVRREGPGYVVNAWASAPPSGDPDHVCRVVPDDDAERGVRVTGIVPSPPRQAG